MNQRLINIALFISFLICYLEWGKENSTYIFQAEWEILFQREHSRDTFTHPLVLIPFIGQLLILFTIFQKRPSRRLTTIGIILMGILVLLITLIGALSMKWKIMLLTIPFITCSFIHFLKRTDQSRL